MPFDYQTYWEQTYKNGGTSGAGSYGQLAEFKAEVINGLCAEMDIKRIIEFGCGDGNQAALLDPGPEFEYLGLDVSESAVKMCGQRFEREPHMSFMTYKPGSFFNRGFLQANLVVCLDVLYHITDEADFVATLGDIFSCRANHVALYTRIPGSAPSTVPTIEDRDIFKYLDSRPFDRKIIPQRYPHLSSAHFILLERR